MGEILKASYSILRENYQQLFVISGIQWLLGQYSYLFEARDLSLILLLYVAGLIIMGYFSLRLSITTICLIKDRVSNSKSSLNELFKRSKKHFWNYLGACLMLGFLLLIISVLFYTGFLLAQSLFMGVLIIILGIIALVHTASYFYLMPTIEILEPDNNGVLTRSIELTKKDRKIALYTVSIILLLYVSPIILPKLIDTEDVIRRILDMLLSIIIYPLCACIGVLLYFRLISDELEST